MKLRLRPANAWFLPWISIALLSPAGVPTAAGAEPPALSPRDYLPVWWDDARTTLTAPARWDGQEWLNFSVDTVAVVGTAAFFDRSLKDWTQRNTNAGWEKAANHFETFGSTGSFAVIGGFYLEGLIDHDPQAESTSFDALSASLVAAGIITPVLKEAAGRSRPRAQQGTYHFRPFRGGASFPSGHATQAFAVASVISMHYDSPWVGGVAYAIAGLVGLARMDHNAHFASDVLAGAMIGTTVGRSLVRLNAGERAERAPKPVAVGPWIPPDGGGGLEVSVDF